MNRMEEELIKWETKESWIEYGKTKHFEELKKSDIKRRSDLNDRRWYNAGLKKKWISDFHFNLGVNNRKSRGYWNDYSKIVNEVNKYMKEKGLTNVPSAVELKKNGYSGLAEVIKSNGGFEKLRDYLGDDHKYGRYKDLDYCLNLAKKIKHDNNLEKLPAEKILIKLGFRGLWRAIPKYHGGLGRFRELLGEYNCLVDRGKWHDLEFTLEKAKELMIKNKLDELPPYEKLRSISRSLANAIKRYHGYSDFRERLDKYLGKPSNSYQLESMLEQYAGGNE